MNETEKRQQIIKSALSFQRTPYHHRGAIKGVGVDCLTFIMLVYQEVGLIGKVDLPYYPSDFNMHDRDETYLRGVLQYGREVEKPKSGDIVLYKFGKKYAHSAIVIEWPLIIHAYSGGNVRLEDAEKCAFLRFGAENKIREHKFLSMW